MGRFFGGGGSPAPVSQTQPAGTYVPAGTQQQTTATTSAPWGPAQPFLLGALQSAQDLYKQGIPQMYGGSYLPAQSPQTQGYVQGVTDITQSGAPQQLIGQGQQVAGNIAGGSTVGQQYLQNLLARGGAANQYASALPGQMGAGNLAQQTVQPMLGAIAGGANVGANPYLNAMYQQASLPMIQQWQNQVAPGINAMFSAAGRYGGAGDPNRAMGATVNQAQTGLGNELGTLGANLYGNAYGQGLQQQTAALGQLANLGLNQTQQQLGLGGLFGQLQGQGILGANALTGGQLQAAAMMPGMAQASYSPYAQLGAAGNVMDQYNTQNQLYQEQLYNYLNGQGAWQTLGNYSNILNQNPAARALQQTGMQTDYAPTQSGFAKVTSDISGLGSLASGISGLGNTLGITGGLGNIFGNLFGGDGASTAAANAAFPNTVSQLNQAYLGNI